MIDVSSKFEIKVVSEDEEKKKDGVDEDDGVIIILCLLFFLYCHHVCFDCGCSYCFGCYLF